MPTIVRALKLTLIACITVSALADDSYYDPSGSASRKPLPPRTVAKDTTIEIVPMLGKHLVADHFGFTSFTNEYFETDIDAPMNALVTSLVSDAIAKRGYTLVNAPNDYDGAQAAYQGATPAWPADTEAVVAAVRYLRARPGHDVADNYLLIVPGSQGGNCQVFPCPGVRTTLMGLFNRMGRFNSTYVSATLQLVDAKTGKFVRKATMFGSDQLRFVAWHPSWGEYSVAEKQEITTSFHDEFEASLTPAIDALGFVATPPPGTGDKK
ncbi:MAG: hypothetical protein JO218_19865 [Burkholderiales bacterium]|nr:hypothetical protein [Burkholderiales bacterium]